MNPFLKRLLQKINSLPLILRGFGKPSYAQIGEDRILDYLFQNIGIQQPTYLDIGTNHPILGSNTYYFYTKGSNGVCIEPNPQLFELIKSIRSRDIVINCGIGFAESTDVDFYIFENSGWSTFSIEEAEYRTNNGYPYKKKIKMSLMTINDILKNNFSKLPDFISIDVEGLDFEILQSLDFEKYAPRVLLVETIRFGNSNKQEVQHEIIDFICNKGYSIYASTFVNTIFLKNNL